MLTCDHYLSPASLADALAAAAAAPDFRFVAGATDLLPWAREGRAGDVHVPVMIDVANIPELKEVRVAEGRVWLGAATPLQRFLDHVDLIGAMPGMPDCAIWFADSQIRESATIGGNIVNASPAADGIPPLLTANAVVELAALRAGAVRRRRMPLADFITGPGRTVAERDEIVVGIACDALNGYGGAFEKVGHRRSLVISTVCLSVVVRIGAEEALEDVRLAVGGVGPVPKRMTEIERALTGHPLTSDGLREVAGLCDGFVRSRSRQDYRKSVVPGFLRRGLVKAMRRAGASAAMGAIAEEVADD
ncbi:FAD binding domain-containing protein [Bradyrhizobium sp. NP1]|uniref:FAD binding domain-containing protein n=1 Tax=Bradyrhizobium sp. NP1 TaxID=3049772 RepID=UPI0025A56D6C|nr:FAD binding domain-containing protein [Bradyrhizobium sp. NP1]WJR76673.1 FAD binding domain-containing protein [Bradyrhizobium sp. NP1]